MLQNVTWYPIYVLGAVGVYLIFRSTYISKVFQRISDIPDVYLKNHVTLQGLIKQVDSDSCLHIQHKPFLQNPLRKHVKVSECLPVHLACLTVGPPGKQWLVQNTINKRVWFKLFFVEDNGLHCAVYLRKNFAWKMCVNHHLVRKGLCRISTSHNLPQSEICQKYQDQLIKHESKASKKGIGLWKVEKIKRTDWTLWGKLKALTRRIFKRKQKHS